MVSSIDALPPAPSTANPSNFDSLADAFVAALSTLRTQINTVASQLVSLYTPTALVYTFSTTTTDSDPGNGTLRLDNATQNTATTIRADLLDANGTTVSGVIDGIYSASSSIVKGVITLRNSSDPTKWLVFNATAVASPAGYRNITVANVASSAASPFANGDVLLMSFQRTGDLGADSAIPYTFSTTTTDSDPGNGTLRLDNATQNAATTIRADLLSSAGATVTGLLDTFDASTSTVKGVITLRQAADPTKWLTFNVTARATPTGYRNITVVNTASSAASPFANGDAIFLIFVRNGDLGATGPAAGWTSEKTSLYTAVSTDRIPANTSGGSFTINLPASPATGAWVEISDNARAFSGSKVLTIGRNGQTIEGTTDDLTVTTAGESLGLRFNGSTWRIY